jgi:hypothetical protein
MSDTEQNKTAEQNKFGLGDFVHGFANPIAKTIDALAGTQIQSCQACAQRRAKLNELMPHFPFQRPLVNSEQKQN